MGGYRFKLEENEEKEQTAASKDTAKYRDTVELKYREYSLE